MHAVWLLCCGRSLGSLVLTRADELVLSIVGVGMVEENFIQPQISIVPVLMH